MNDTLYAALHAVAQAAQILLARIGAAMVLAFVAFVLFTGEARAQTCPAKATCDPVNERDRTLCGAELKATTATGEWRAYWYPIEKSATQWKWCPFQWATLEKYRLSPKAVIAIVDAIKDAPSATQAIADAMTLHSVKPAPGSMDEYEFKLLHYAACQALRANPPTTWSVQPAPCVAPTPPAAPAGWKAYGGTIFKHAGGKVSSVVAGKTAAKDAPCKGVTVATVGTFIYQELVGGVAGEATRCVRPTVTGEAAAAVRLALEAQGEAIARAHAALDDAMQAARK